MMSESSSNSEPGAQRQQLCYRWAIPTSDLYRQALTQTSRKKGKPKFACEDCLDDWGKLIENEFMGDPSKYNPEGSDPKAGIPIRVFSSFGDYKNHVLDTHRNLQVFSICTKKNCLRDRYHLRHQRPGQIRYIDAPHGNIKCKICNLTFQLKEHHDRHVEVEHLCLESSGMTRTQIFNLYLKYKNCI